MKKLINLANRYFEQKYDFHDFYRSLGSLYSDHSSYSVSTIFQSLLVVHLPTIVEDLIQIGEKQIERRDSNIMLLFDMQQNCTELSFEISSVDQWIIANFFDVRFFLDPVSKDIKNLFYWHLIEQLFNHLDLAVFQKNKIYQDFWKYVIQNHGTELLHIISSSSDKAAKLHSIAEKSFSNETIERYQAMVVLHDLKTA